VIDLENFFLQVNVEFGLDPKIAEAICQAADQDIDGSLYEEHFPLGNYCLIDGSIVPGNEIRG